MDLDRAGKIGGILEEEDKQQDDQGEEDLGRDVRERRQEGDTGDLGQDVRERSQGGGAGKDRGVADTGEIKEEEEMEMLVIRIKQKSLN